MSELTVGYGQVVLSLFTDLGIRPNILAVVDNIETMKIIVQSGGGIAIVPRACAENEVALGLLKALSIAPARNVAFSLFRRREPLSRRKEAALAELAGDAEGIAAISLIGFSDNGIDIRLLTRVGPPTHAASGAAAQAWRKRTSPSRVNGAKACRLNRLPRAFGSASIPAAPSPISSRSIPCPARRR